MGGAAEQCWLVLAGPHHGGWKKTHTKTPKFL